VPDWQTTIMHADGLHLGPGGQKFVFSRVMEAVKARYLPVAPNELPLHFPAYNRIDAEHPDATFDALYGYAVDRMLPAGFGAANGTAAAANGTAAAPKPVAATKPAAEKAPPAHAPLAPAASAKERGAVAKEGGAGGRAEHGRARPSGGSKEDGKSSGSGRRMLE
jgi:hypothetical protein